MLKKIIQTLFILSVVCLTSFAITGGVASTPTHPAPRRPEQPAKKPKSFEDLVREKTDIQFLETMRTVIKKEPTKYEINQQRPIREHIVWSAVVALYCYAQKQLSTENPSKKISTALLNREVCNYASEFVTSELDAFIKGHLVKIIEHIFISGRSLAGFAYKED